MIMWIRNPLLWGSAQEVIARDTPRWTNLFWKKVLDNYLSLGGKLGEGAGKEQYKEEVVGADNRRQDD